VDGARLPVCLVSEGRELSQVGIPILVTIAGVILGTIVGARLLRRVSERWFRTIVALILQVLGAAMIVQAFQ
ncbi:MAG TPA: hypothetical protein VH138_10425, partial [Vicinamibacterales bacterium]|nr:hypothetical protein [Vicinamibacterales bacterium]